MELNQVTLPIHSVIGEAASTGVTIYFEVDDVDARVQALKDVGLVIDEEPACWK